MRIKLAEEMLRGAGCELVLGKPQDDFRTFRYERKELVNLIGDCPIVYPSGRDVISGEILDSCPDLQAVVKSSIGIETVDVDAATDLGILCCNSPTVENYMGVAEATMGLIVALFKRLKFNEAVHTQRRLERAGEPRHADARKNRRHYRRRPHRSKRRQTARRLGHESDWL